jgi:hypothetical protein
MKSFETIVHLKTQIEESKRVEELLKDQINEKEESCHKLEAKIVDLRKKVEKSNKFLNSLKILDELLESQRSPYHKSGLGYKEEATHAEENTSKKHEVSPLKKEDNVAKKPSTQGKENFKRTKKGRHQEAIFGTPKQGCSGFGQKSQEYWNTRRNSMMRTSYSMTRRRTEVRKGDIFDNMDAQRSSYKEKRHLQKWVKKTEQPEQNEILKGSSNVSSTEAYVGDSGISHVHLQADLVYVAYICELYVWQAAYIW